MRNQRRQKPSKRPGKLKEFEFLVRETWKNGKTYKLWYPVYSMSLNGAVRKLYQEHEFEELLSIREIGQKKRIDRKVDVSAEVSIKKTDIRGGLASQSREVHVILPCAVVQHSARYKLYVFNPHRRFSYGKCKQLVLRGLSFPHSRNSRANGKRKIVSTSHKSEDKVTTHARTGSASLLLCKIELQLTCEWEVQDQIRLCLLLLPQSQLARVWEVQDMENERIEYE